jgi:hypothetical protein
VGHRYSPAALLQAHNETQERELWAAVLALEEASNLVNRVSNYFEPEVGDRIKQEAERKLQQAESHIRPLLPLE